MVSSFCSSFGSYFTSSFCSFLVSSFGSSFGSSFICSTGFSSSVFTSVFSSAFSGSAFLVSSCFDSSCGVFAQPFISFVFSLNFGYKLYLKKKSFQVLSFDERNNKGKNKKKEKGLTREKEDKQDLYHY